MTDPIPETTEKTPPITITPLVGDSGQEPIVTWPPADLALDSPDLPEVSPENQPLEERDG